MIGISANDKIRVIIYGIHSPDWMRALDPASEVWGKISGVEEVLLVADGAGASVPPPQNLHAKTVVIPLMEAHALSCPLGFYRLMPSLDNLMRFGMKHHFADFMKKVGLSHLCPTHFTRLEEIRYPCVIKRLNLCSGMGIRLLRSRQQLDACVQDVMWQNQSVVIQEALLEGDEYVTHLVVKNGRILWHASFAYALQEDEYIRSPANVAVASRASAAIEVLKAFEDCLIRANYSGPCNIDYKITECGELKILEINPRLGGSLMRPDAVDLLKEALEAIIYNAQLSRS